MGSELKISLLILFYSKLLHNYSFGIGKNAEKMIFQKNVGKLVSVFILEECTTVRNYLLYEEIQLL